MSLQVQFMTLSLMAGSGAVLGIGYDIIEVLIREFRLRRMATALMDIVYWLMATLFVFQVLIYANSGQVRLFVFIGLFVGVIIYSYMLSNLIQKITTWVINVFIKVLRGAWKVIHILIVRPLIYMVRVLRFIIGYLQAVAVFAGRIMLQWVRYVSKWIMRWF